MRTLVGFRDEMRTAIAHTTSDIREVKVRMVVMGDRVTALEQFKGTMSKDHAALVTEVADLKAAQQREESKVRGWMAQMEAEMRKIAVSSGASSSGRTRSGLPRCVGSSLGWTWRCSVR